MSLVVLLLLALSFGAAATTISIAITGGLEEEEEYKVIVERFMREYPSIQVQVQQAPDNYTDRVLTQILAGVGPDVIWINTGGIFGSLISNESIQPLNRFIESDPDFNLKRYNLAAWDAMTINGRIWVAPMRVYPTLFFYNKDIFETSGVALPDESWTWSRLVDAGRKLLLKRPDGTTTQWGFAPDGFGFGGRNVEPFIWSNDGYVVTPNDTFGLDMPEARQGLQFFADLAMEHDFAYSPEDAEIRASWQRFPEGDIAMFTSPAWQVRTYRVSGVPFEWDVAPFPKSPHTNDRKVWMRVVGFGMNAVTKHPAEAWQLIKYMMGNYAQNLIASRGNPPSLYTAGASYIDPKQAPTNAHLVLEALEYSRIRDHRKWADLDRFTAFEDALNEEWDKLLQRKQGLDTFIAQLKLRTAHLF